MGGLASVASTSVSIPAEPVDKRRSPAKQGHEADAQTEATLIGHSVPVHRT